MTKKEMAEQFADDINGFEPTCSLLSAKDKRHAYRLGRYDGFLVGLEVGETMQVKQIRDASDKRLEPILYRLKDLGVIKSWYYNGTYHAC